jgi:hypothetical protein
MKPGYKTTEFWLAVVANTVGALLTSGITTNDTILKILGLVAMVLSSLGYTVTRSMAKEMQAKQGQPFVPRPDPKPYEDREEDKEEPGPALIHDKLLAAVNPGCEHTIEVFKDRKTPISTLVIQITKEAEAFSVENIVIGGEKQWQIPSPAFVFKAQPVIVFEKRRRILPDEKIQIIVKNRVDETRAIFGEVAAVIEPEGTGT